MKPTFFRLAFPVALLVSPALADEQCRLVIGQTCQGQEVYIMNFNRGSNSANRGDCQRLPTICTLDQFQPWIREFKASGDSRHGIHGPLDNSDAVDSEGRMLLVQDKFVTKCFKKRRNGGSWEHQGTVRCPASKEACGGGMVFDPSQKRCMATAPSGDTDGTDANGAMTLGFQMVQQQHNHFSNGSEIDPNLNRQQAVAGGVPGLVDPKQTAATAGGEAREPRSGSKRGGGSAAGAGPGTSNGSGAAMAGAGAASEGSADARAKAADAGSNFASQSFGLEKDGVVAASGVAAAAGVGGTGGASWFGGGEAGAIAGGAAGEHEFGAAEGASRGPASGESLRIEDPADYFMRSDIDVSLFKRVTAQCRKKEKALVLAP